MATTQDSSSTNTGPAIAALKMEAFNHECAADVFNWLQMIAWQIEQDAEEPHRVRRWASLANYLAETWATTCEGSQEEAQAKADALTSKAGAV